MNYFLDVPSGEFDDVRDLMKTKARVTPYDSYPHPSDGRYHRIEFERENPRDKTKNCLGRHGIESFPLDGSLARDGSVI